MIISPAFAAADAADHYSSMFQDPTFWVGVAFCLTIFAIIKLAGKTVSDALQARADSITFQFEEAKKLREESQALLEKSQKKLENTQKDIEAAIQDAQIKAEQYKQTAQAEIEAKLKKKEEAAERRLALASEEASEEIRDMAISLALNSVEHILATKMEGEAGKDLITQAIDNLPNLLSKEDLAK